MGTVDLQRNALRRICPGFNVVPGNFRVVGPLRRSCQNLTDNESRIKETLFLVHFQNAEGVWSLERIRRVVFIVDGLVSGAACADAGYGK